MFEKLRHIFFPDKFSCIACDRELHKPSKLGFCEVCRKGIKPILGDEQCLKCGTYLPTLAEYCPNCRVMKRRFAAVRAAMNYNGPAVITVFRLKAEGGGWLGKYCAHAMHRKYLDEIKYADDEYSLESDLMIPMPLHKRRRTERGHNQAESIAKHLAPLLGLPFTASLVIKPVETQKQASSQTAKQREENLKGAFTVINPEEINGKRVMIIDDVITTGATINELARALLKAGAARVCGMAYAATINPLFKGED